jgi:putative DNA primase/helicase
MADGDPIDFADLAAALLDRAEQLVAQWLPGGKVAGAEYVCADLQGGEGGSCSVNLRTGRWADFSGDERGSDLISLYAAIHNLNQGQAAREIMRDLGWQRSAPAAPAAAAPAPAAAKRRSMWRPLVPVPATAPQPTFKHFERGLPQHHWLYEFDGQRYGYVCRFQTSDGGKEILPYTWCVDESDDRGSMRWHWKQWDEPRPLYVPAGLLSADCRLPVVVVEGEKCALAGHQLLGHEFDFVSWPGGSKAWSKCSWGWLAGRAVYLWPDCDAQRERLSRDEREAGVDPLTKPLLPEAKQPGMAAMVGIGTLLLAEQGCTVFMCPVPAPGAVSDGWDLADAVAQGWGPEEVRGFIRGARVFEPAPPTAPQAAEGGSTPTLAGAGDEEVPRWRNRLLEGRQGIMPVRENVVLALDGLPGVPGIPEAAGLVAFNEFTNDVVKLADTPWGTTAGVWEETDELELGNWLVRRHRFPSVPRGTLEEAVAMVAKRHRYHPVRAELDRVRGRWDGEKRLACWLRRCCLEEDEYDDQAPLQQYLARVGTWMVMAVCARVLQPGCKFDYMLILEGPQGVGKSTLARLLGGDYFADTGLVLGDKDSYQNLQGVLVYEWGELDALSKAEVQKVKAFISSSKDRFRASFDRRAKDYPRQVVFVGTTNEDHYLTDGTGNRRFWPVRVTRHIDLDWFAAHRDQLFAEALSYLEAGQRFHPTPREQRALFDEQQQQRQIENAIESAVRRFLYDPDQRVTPGGDNGALVEEITAQDLLGKIGISIDKQTNVLLRQATAALRHCGWERFRSTKRGDRPWMFKRPPAAPWERPSGSHGSAHTASTSTRHDAAAPPAGVADDCPF